MSADPTPDPLKSDYLNRPDARRHLKVLAVLRDWDPIGVNSDSHQDEYDGYAPELIGMLDAGPSVQFIADWLLSLGTEHMGLGDVDRQHTTSCAMKLVEFWAATRDAQ
ncbi:MAG: hypothetical protein H0T51_14455 [Pirellulales bacterium]|nr:hypothetical protein [Pirellulales bacterium]